MRRLLIAILMVIMGLGATPYSTVGVSAGREPLAAYWIGLWDPIAEPVVETTSNYYLEDGTWIGSESPSGHPDGVSQDVIAGAVAALGGAVGYNFAPQVLSWLWNVFPAGYASTLFGYYAIVSGPYVGAAIGAGMMMY